MVHSSNNNHHSKKKKRKTKEKEREKSEEKRNTIESKFCCLSLNERAHITSTQCVYICGTGDNVKRTLAQNDNLDDGFGLSSQHVKGQTMGASTMIKTWNEYYLYGTKKKRTYEKFTWLDWKSVSTNAIKWQHTLTLREHWNSYQVEFSILLTELKKRTVCVGTLRSHVFALLFIYLFIL